MREAVQRQELHGDRIDSIEEKRRREREREKGSKEKPICNQELVQESALTIL